MKAGVLAEPVLVGREQELEELMRRLDSAFEGKGKTVFVSGEAGSGKTRLTHEFLKTAREKGVTVLSGWCLSNAAVPYFPFVEAFKSHFSAREGELAEKDGLEINAWLTGLKQAEKTAKYGSLVPQAWQDLTFAAVTEALLSISAKKPTILFIEDIHWADSASLALLHYIARTTRSERVLVLATFRSEELTADAEGHPHPLVEELRLMRHENLFTEIKLPNFNQASVTKVAENMMGGSVSPELAEKLAEESRGNALFVVESLRMLFERKSIVKDRDQWSLAVYELGIPSKFKDIILRRLGRLKFNQRRVLDAASVIGDKFDVELLGAVLGQDSLEVLETLNRVAKSTSLVCVEENFYRFDHTKSRQAIYEELALPLKRGYHARVAESLESTSRSGRLPFGEITYHYTEAGNEEKAVKFAMAAGQDALERFSNTEAIKYFAYVTEKVSDAPENAETKRVALEGLGDAYYANCMFTKALKVFERLASSETGAVRLRAYRKAMDAVRSGDMGRVRLVELARKAEPYAVSDRLESARIRCLSGNTLEDYEAALRVFEEEYSLPDVAKALFPLGMALLSSRQHGKGVGAFLRSISLWEEIGDLRGLLDAVYFAGHFFLVTGVVEVFSQETWNMFNRAAQIGEKIGYYSLIGTARLCLGIMSEYQGRLEEATSRILKAFEISALTDTQYTKNLRGYAILARQYAKLGDLKRAEEYLKIASTPPTIFPSNPRLNRRQELWVILAQAVLFAAKNNWKEAEQYFEKSIEIAKTTTTSVEIEVRRNYAWALNRQGRTEEAKMKLEEIDQISKEIKKDFARVNVQASLMAPRLVAVGEEFEMRLDLVNVSKKQGSLVKAEDVVPPEFKVTTPPVNGSLQNGTIKFNEENISTFQVVTIKLGLKALKTGTFSLSPLVTYVDEMGETKTCKPDPITTTVQPAKPAFEVLPNRVSTGYGELDALLFGGIPENYAVVLASPASDERELLITRFLEAGAKADETTFCLTAKAGHAKALAEKYPSNFYLFICNPQADALLQDLPNVFKLKGIESLTEIDIALTKAFRTLNPSATGGKRICIEVVSDVLLQHHAVITRKWLSALLPNLKSKKFTILAVINPQMHPQEEVQAIIGLFEGEIQISEKETAKGMERVLQIRRLQNQKYLENELVLTREMLEL